MSAAEIIALLGLERHPEGGWYKQTFVDEVAGDAGEIRCLFVRVRDQGG